MNPHVKGLAPGARAAIDQRPWPGNVRELDDRMGGAMIMSEAAMIGPVKPDLESCANETVPIAFNAARANADRRASRQALASLETVLTNSPILVGTSRSPICIWHKKYMLPPWG